MKNYYRHITWGLCSMIMLLCLSCCSSDGDDNQDEHVPSQLAIHIYLPDNPIVTRADIGGVPSQDAAEKVISSLYIWVFVNEAKGTLLEGDLVGYLGNLTPQVSTLSDTPLEYQMTVSEEFATKKPKVDVYVMANVDKTIAGFELNERVTVDQLKSVMFRHSETTDLYGLTSPMTTPPPNGLPMSGVLIGKEIGGSLPVLKVLTPVTVVRAMSKVRFIFSRTTQQTDIGEDQELKITRITLDDYRIPKAEYLFLEGEYTDRANHIIGESDADYEPTAPLVPLTDADHIQEYNNPSEYTYQTGTTGLAYEQLINTGIEAGHLTRVGQFYLRETDRPVTGKIYYTIGGVPKETSFGMKEENAGDFSRNHTWIVYGYFAGKELLKVSSVDIAPWVTTVNDQNDHPVYNW